MKMVYRDSYDFACQSCAHRFHVVTTFREKHADEPVDMTKQSGYPEKQPACPVCQSHDAVQVRVDPVPDEPNSGPRVQE